MTKNCFENNVMIVSTFPIQDAYYELVQVYFKVDSRFNEDIFLKKRFEVFKLFEYASLILE